MEYSILKKDKYVVITVSDSINIISELTELKQIIDSQLREDNSYIAVQFMNADYLYSGAISVLVSAYKVITEKDGELCIIEPNGKIMNLLDQMCITNIIPVHNSVEELE